VAALAVATAWGGPAIAALGKTGHSAKPTAKAEAKAKDTTDPPGTFDSEFRGGQLVTLLTKPGGYKTVFTCTIVVKKRVPKRFHLRKVIISTGFGGEAGSVARRHPAG
jgi:hypothetical protein